MKSRTMVFLTSLALAASSLAQQPNTDAASLVVNGTATGPFPVTGVPIFSGVPATMTFSGMPGAGVLLAQAARVRTGEMTTVFGILDLQLDTLEVIASLGLALDESGTLSLQIPVPDSLPVGVRFGYQALMAAAEAPAGAMLSGATEITSRVGIIDGSLSLGDDNFQAISVAARGLRMEFYSQTYTSLFVNANGSITFEAGSTDFTPTPTDMLTGRPRIASCWTDISPNVGGSVTWRYDLSQANPLLTVAWQDVPSFGGAGGLFSHSIDLRLVSPSDPTPVSEIRIVNPVDNPASPFDAIVGISPGNGISPSLAARDLTQLQNQGGFAGLENDALFEFFRGLTSPTLVGSSWDLPGTAFTFVRYDLDPTGASYALF